MSIFQIKFRMLLRILFRNKYSNMSQSKARQDVENFHLLLTWESHILRPHVHFILFCFRDKLRFCNIQITRRHLLGIGHCECPQKHTLEKFWFIGGVSTSSLLFILANVFIFLVQRGVTGGIIPVRYPKRQQSHNSLMEPASVKDTV